MDAVAVLRAAGVSGDVAVEFDWGECVLWHLGPSVRVSVHGRRETVYSEDPYVKNLSFVFGAGEWDALLRDYPTDLALIASQRPTRNLLELDPEWVIAYVDSVSAIAVRNESPLLPRIVSVGATAGTGESGTCFP